MSIHRQRDWVAGTTQVAHPADEDAWCERCGCHCGRFSQVVTALHGRDCHGSPSVAIGSEPGAEGCIAYRVSAIEELVKVRDTIVIGIAFAALIGKIEGAL